MTKHTNVLWQLHHLLLLTSRHIGQSVIKLPDGTAEKPSDILQAATTARPSKESTLASGFCVHSVRQAIQAAAHPIIVGSRFACVIQHLFDYWSEDSFTQSGREAQRWCTAARCGETKVRPLLGKSFISTMGPQYKEYTQLRVQCLYCGAVLTDHGILLLVSLLLYLSSSQSAFGTFQPTLYSFLPLPPLIVFFLAFHGSQVTMTLVGDWLRMSGSLRNIVFLPTYGSHIAIFTEHKSDIN
jgi:hypothetical protein